jgi:hypothetical protein
MPAFVWSAPTWAPPAGDATPDAAPTAAPSSAGGAGVAVHRAALDRPEAESGDHAPPSASDAGRPQPDLDTLARQVYAVLRRRLAAERRREG